MKLLNKSSFILLGMGVLALNSCFKKFDESNYAPPFTINGYSAVAQIAPTNLVGYWAFNGGYIDSVSGNVGVNTNTSFLTGFQGQSMKGALQSYVLSTPGAGMTGIKSFTLSEWINTPPPSVGIIGLFSLAKTTAFWGNLEMFIENGSTNTNGKLRIHMAKGSGDFTYAIDNVQNLFDRWVNITVSYDAATNQCKLYINGSLSNTGTAGSLTGDLAFSDVGKVVFGCVQFQTTPSQTTGTGSQSWASFLTGQVDEVRVYNKALSANDISSMIILQGKGK